MERVTAPFTAEQVDSINGYQESGFMHEFTCGRPHAGTRVLCAAPDGLECPTCGYRQSWVHDFMANRQWEQMRDAHRRQFPTMNRGEQ